MNATMNGWTMAEALEAEFGGFRVAIDGADVRGYWNRAAAEAHAERVNARRGTGAAIVRDGRDPRAASRDAHYDALAERFDTECGVGL